MTQLKKLPLQRITYSVHMYTPLSFTHQGLYGFPNDVAYPGVIDRRTWNAAALRRHLQPVVDFQRRHDVSIYVGEFSAVAYAPNDSAYRYLRDLIRVFEELGWNWTYHAFREWAGWSVEHEGASPTNLWYAGWTTRKQLLMGWFARNK